MLHAHPLWLEVSMLSAKWYTGTRKERRKHGNKVSRQRGWSKWILTTGSYHQLHYYFDNLLLFNTGKRNISGCGSLCVPWCMCVKWYRKMDIAFAQVLWFVHELLSVMKLKDPLLQYGVLLRIDIGWHARTHAHTRIDCYSWKLHSFTLNREDGLKCHNF